MIMCEDELSLDLLHNLSAERLGPHQSSGEKKGFAQYDNSDWNIGKCNLRTLLGQAG